MALFTAIGALVSGIASIFIGGGLGDIATEIVLTVDAEDEADITSEASE